MQLAHDISFLSGFTDFASQQVTNTTRDSVTVRLDSDHTTGNGGPGEVVVPSTYVGAHVDYGYARTVDTAQGATTDHSFSAASEATSAERAYVALSRGRISNRVYATADQGWVDAIGHARSHTLATDQQPDLTRTDRLGIDVRQLPDGLAARRAALHVALGRRSSGHRRTGRGDAAGRQRRGLARTHAPDDAVQARGNPDRDESRAAEPERSAGLGM